MDYEIAMRSNLKHLVRNNWRASLVPAAAVIPAPIAYIKVVAVKKLVVELLTGFLPFKGFVSLGHPS